MFFSDSFLECQPSGMAACAEEDNTELAECTEVTVCLTLPRLGIFLKKYLKGSTQPFRKKGFIFLLHAFSN
jgi:hypothetical protein